MSSTRRSPFASIPAPSGRRLALRVTADAERQIRSGHPWIFDRSLISTSHEGAPGDLAVVFDRRRDFLAIGLWDPTSPIRVRLLHRGSPTTIDDRWFAAAIDRAIAARADRFPVPGSPTRGFPTAGEGGEVLTDAYRVVHGENDGLGGLVVDCYADRLVVEVFSAAWLPHLSAIVDALRERFDPAQIVLRLAGLVRRGDTFGLLDGQQLLGDGAAGSDDATVVFRENGLTFRADLAHGQKTGHFLDQRDNRRLVRDLSAGGDVLDVFSCTGGFSVHAAAGGARSVTSIDQSAPALAALKVNMAANAAANAGTTGTRHNVRCGDAFEEMEHLVSQRQTFDVVVIDPPSFARRRSQVPGALDAYRRLAALGAHLVAPAGVLVQASCSARIDAATLQSIVDGALGAAGRDAAERWVTAQPPDHPIGFAQGAYLDAVWTRMR